MPDDDAGGDLGAERSTFSQAVGLDEFVSNTSWTE